jgi:hypothetical protein
MRGKDQLGMRTHRGLDQAPLQIGVQVNVRLIEHYHVGRS